MEFSTLSGRATLTLSAPLRSGLRFFPDVFAGCLTSAPCGDTFCPGSGRKQQTAGLPRFVCATFNRPLRSPPSAGGSLVRDGSALSPRAWPLTFWFQPVSLIWLVSL
jgi:hypothetical protein